jgi:hypothetical protein
MRQRLKRRCDRACDRKDEEDVEFNLAERQRSLWIESVHSHVRAFYLVAQDHHGALQHRPRDLAITGGMRATILTQQRRICAYRSGRGGAF